MTAQLILIDTDDASTWKIPEATKQIGRKGLAEARAVLHAIPRRSEDEVDGGDHHHHPAAA